MTNPGHQLQAQRIRTEKICPICAAPFTGFAIQTYCGDPCRNRAHRLKNKKTTADE